MKFVAKFNLKKKKRKVRNIPVPFRVEHFQPFAHYLAHVILLDVHFPREQSCRKKK